MRVNATPQAKREPRPPRTVETELKFQVPPEARAAVQRATATPAARSLTLRARYFDTPDRRLAAAGMALRLRKEGRQWVQTLKGHGENAMTRIEHEVLLGALRGEPALDVARHAGTPAAALLAAALAREPADSGEAHAAAGGTLQLVYETHVRRTLRLVRSGGALIEVAFDRGEIFTGSRHLPLCEVEFELKRGPVEGLLALASRWVERHGIWLDVRSKAERGERLHRGTEAGPVASAQRPRLDAEMSLDSALRAIVGVCLAQVLPNAADVAGGVGTAEHLHQLRVGLRRLRCALHVFGDGSSEVNEGWPAALAALFGRLGAARDRDVITATLLPALRQAGAPLAELAPDPGDADPGKALRDVACNQLLLQLIGYAHGAAAKAEGTAPDAPDAAHAPDAPEPPPPEPVRTAARQRIRHMQRQLKADAKVFLTLDDALRHRTRRRLKRLRYCLEFFAALLPSGRVKLCLRRLRVAQEVLGRYNDLAVAEALFMDQTSTDPRAWFAVGWLKAQREHAVPEAQRALLELAKVDRV